jgi:hypothetical protein
MKFHQGVVAGALVIAGAVLIPSQANAQTPPPGAIFDMATAHPASFSPDTVYTQFTTSFVASASTMFVSFAFREAPAFFSFDDASVIKNGGATNLLADPGLELDTLANVGTNFPVGWSRWIQPIDTSAIGVVAGGGNNEACGNSGPHTGSFFWCDGSVQGYDALYQQLTGLSVGSTYNISFWVTDNSGEAMNNPTIDMLVYAGTALPVGTEPIGPPPGAPSTTPLPSSIWLTLAGIAGVGLYLTFRAGMRRRA